MVEDIRSQVCPIDIPPQRQQLFLGSKRLQEDGCVLALHGVVAGSTLHLVSAKSVPASLSAIGLMSKCLVHVLFREESRVGVLGVSV